MKHVVVFENAAAAPIAAIRCSTQWKVIGATIRGALDEVWAHLRATPPGGIHHNVVVYLDGRPEVEIGVQISPPFTPGERVMQSATPSGPVARTVHTGPYRDLGAAHDAVRAECKVRGRALAGPRWEIYGDWNEREELLTTEVVYLLDESSGHGAA